MRKTLPGVLALILLLQLLLALPAFAAEEEVVELKWYTIAPEMTDHKLVTDALNEYTKEKIGVVVDYHYLGATDYKEKVPVMLSSGQEIDIILSATNYSTHIPTFAKMGALLAIDDYIDEYLPLTKAAVPEYIWSGPAYEGKIYGVPIYKDMASNGDIMWNKTLLEEIGVTADLENFTWDAMWEWEDVLLETKEKMDAAGKSYDALFYPPEDIKYYGGIDNITGYYYAATNIEGKNTYAGYDVGTVFNAYATDEFREWCLYNYRMVQEGIYPIEEWTLMDPDDAVWLGGDLPFKPTAGYVYMLEDQWSSEWNVGISYSDTAVCDATTVGKYVNSVTTFCKNPEKALQLLDLANGDPYYGTMIRFGIEDTHWQFNEDGKTVTFQFDGSRNADASNRGYFYWYGWYFGNLFSLYTPTDITAPDFIDLMRALNDYASPSSFIGYKFANDNIVDELAACNNVVDQYFKAVWYGSLGSEDEVNATIDEFIAALEANGVQKIIDEVQGQLDAFKET